MLAMMYPFMTLNDDMEATHSEVAYFRRLVRNNAHHIIEFSRDGGSSMPQLLGIESYIV